ncbi:MAG: hypothetical protein J6J41_04995 [Clostridia bacterium]|jgi:hypothetical protein|nr:hypothetical protein [Clostridia bacterium]
MDIQKIITDLVSKLTGNADLIKQFKLDPAEIIKKLTGQTVNADQLKEIVAGVTKALGGNLGDVVSGGKGFLAKLKSFFGA